MDSEAKITASDDDSTEAIKRQMEETRGSLTGKLEQLEQHVVGTVQEAAEVVASVRTAVSDTVESVTCSVRETVDTVAETMDLRKQFDRHPWPFMAGAAAAGFLGGRLMYSSEEPSYGETSRASESSSVYGTTPRPSQYSQARQRFSQTSAADDYTATSTERSSYRSQSPGWMDALAPTLQRVRSLAIGTALGVMRDMLSKQMPPELASEVCTIFDDATTSLGGQPLKQTNFTQPSHSAETATL
jgi:ElaB/YqjD/DUF883 family membrane-anchored ribosome-binding protein